MKCGLLFSNFYCTVFSVFFRGCCLIKYFYIIYLCLGHNSLSISFISKYTYCLFLIYVLYKFYIQTIVLDINETGTYILRVYWSNLTHAKDVRLTKLKYIWR